MAEEEDMLDLDDVDRGIQRRLCTRPACMVGKVFMEKAVNSFTLADIMIKAFRPKGKLTARDWGNGLLIFSFEHEEDWN
ncbi:hypothetical protein ACS0TY_023576 [Phlomoides rotata]